jgi:TonB family protein
MYPELARRMKLAGLVKLELTIAPDGKVKNVKVVGGHPLLAESAADAAKKWVYEPAHEQTVAIVDVKFEQSY